MIKKIYNFIKKENLNDFDLVYKTLFKKEKIVIFDVGANFGQSLKRFKSYLNIKNYYSFEPLKECYDYIVKNYNEAHYHHYNLAIGKSIESKIFYVNNKKANSSFHKLNTNSNWWKNKKDHLTRHNIIDERSVEVTTLDYFIQNNNVNNIDILKIDTQNHEDEVLLGLNQTLSKKFIKFIELEINVGDGYQKNLNFIDIESILNKNNYKLYGINNSGNKLKNSNLQFEVMYKINE